MIALNLHNEINPLEAVVLGLPDSFGGTPKLQDCYDPKSREHVLKGTFPTQQNVINEMNAVKSVLLNYGVEVFQPKNIEGLNQIFSRDIGFVIDNKFIVSNIIDNRKEEVSAIDTLIKNIRAEDIIPIPTNARVEGGDVMLCDCLLYTSPSPRD